MVTAYAKRVKKIAKHHGQQKLQEYLEEKMMRAKHPKRMTDPDVDQQKTNQWVRSTVLKGETEGLMIEAQYLSLATRSYHHRIIKDATNPHCRICGKLMSLLITLSRGALY